MKILLWAGNKPIPELLRVAEELKDRGVLVDFGVLPETLTQCDKKFWDSFQQYDLVYYRTGLGEALKAELGLQIDNKVPILNRSVLSNYLISNKLYQAVQAQKLGIKIPKTVPRPIDFKETAQSLGVPFVFKAAHGIQGDQVYLIDTVTDFEEAKKCTKGDTLAQEYIPNAGDFRALFFADKVKHVYKRVPAQGSFKANVSQGGLVERVTDVALLKSLSAITEKICRHYELDVAGIDVIEHLVTKELYFIESNINPGWRGLEESGDERVSAEVAEWLIGLAAKN